MYEKHEDYSMAYEYSTESYHIVQYRMERWRCTAYTWIKNGVYFSCIAKLY